MSAGPLPSTARAPRIRSPHAGVPVGGRPGATTLWIVGLAALLATGCRGASWTVGPDVIAPARRVAEALGDPTAPPLETLDPGSIPRLDPPRNVRPCCSFGMDQRVVYQGVEIPGYRKGNVTSPDDLGHHEYDHGFVAVRPNDRALDVERNGLVYTCRGGFVDTAHVRDYADMTFFLGLRIAELLPRGGMIPIPGDGALRVVTVRPAPEQTVAQVGRFRVAARLAEHAAWQLSIWHEIASWYGVKSTPGFSEKVSTFSPEDLYSNAIGVKVGAALIDGRIPVTRDDYNVAMDVWLRAVLERLGAVPAPATRSVIAALDGRWWDSKRPLPDTKLVLRRDLDITPPIDPWRAGDALSAEEIPATLRALCEGAGAVLPLSVSDAVGSLRIADLVTVEIQPEAWATAARFPFLDEARRTFTSSEYGQIMKALRARMQEELGEGFDRPGGPRPAPK